MPDSGDLIRDPAARPAAALAAATPPPPKGKGADLRRRRGLWLGLLAAVVVVGLIAWGLYYLLIGSRQVATDDAYVGADTALVTPLISGQVTAIPVRETERVVAGQPVVILDPADARIAVDQAKASLAEAEREVRGYFADDTALAADEASRRAQVAQADAQIVGAEGDVARARTDLGRRQALSQSGAVSGDELTTAENRFSTAVAGLAAARAARAAALANVGAASGARAINAARIAGTSVEDNPDVVAARARLAAAELSLSRSVIPAPVTGVVSKKAVEIGQQVQPGAVTMQIVPTEAMYVDANFKEGQLARVRPGQRVVLTSDLYGSGVKFHGVVTGLSGGTGTAFSLIPAQNASGNWIKIVQRLPVRITLDPADLARHPLRVGLSMDAVIDVASAPARP